MTTMKFPNSAPCRRSRLLDASLVFVVLLVLAKQPANAFQIDDHLLKLRSKLHPPCTWICLSQQRRGGTRRYPCSAEKLLLQRQSLSELPRCKSKSRFANFSSQLCLQADDEELQKENSKDVNLEDKEDSQSPTESKSREERKKWSGARISRRARKQPNVQRLSSKNETSTDKGIIPSIVGPLVVLLVVASILKSLFLPNDTSYYYYSYESSVFESQNYGADGKVESSRKESRNVQSNIPGYISSFEQDYQGSNKDRSFPTLGPVIDNDDVQYLDSLILESIPLRMDSWFRDDEWMGF